MLVLGPLPAETERFVKRRKPSVGEQDVAGCKVLITTKLAKAPRNRAARLSRQRLPTSNEMSTTAPYKQKAGAHSPSRARGGPRRGG